MSYKWEQENGIFEFDGKPLPKLLAAISNAKWEAMIWGPYSNDRPEFYTCWIDFCEKYNPGMKYLPHPMPGPRRVKSGWSSTSKKTRNLNHSSPRRSTINSVPTRTLALEAS